MFNLRTLVLVIMTGLWTFLGMLTCIVVPSGRLYSYLARVGWARQILWLAGMKVTIRGGERVDWGRTHVVVANHQSQLDIPLLFASLPMPLRFMAKRSLFYVPFLGWSLAAARFIPVDRGRKGAGGKALAAAAAKVRSGASVIVFPEGTRTPDGRLQTFKSGAFVLALRAEVPLLPVAIRGTFDMLAKTSWGVRPGAVELIIGEPLEMTGLGVGDKERLRRGAQEAVAGMLERGEPRGIVLSPRASAGRPAPEPVED